MKQSDIDRLVVTLSKLPKYRLGQIIALSGKSIEALYNVSDDTLISLINQTFKVVQDDTIEKAPTYGKIYIHKGKDIKTIYREELEKYINLGYTLGRKDKK